MIVLLPSVTEVATYVIAWMLQTHSMAPSLIYTVSFSLCKIIQEVSVKTYQSRRCLTSHLDRTYNDHAQKCRCLCNHSPTSIEKEIVVRQLAMKSSTELTCQNGLINFRNF